MGNFVWEYGRRKVPIFLENIKSKYKKKCLKSTSNVLKDFEARTSESSQIFCQDQKFKILDYLPCHANSLFKIIFWHTCRLIFKIFGCIFYDNVGKKIICHSIDHIN